MPPAVFETTVQNSERPQTHVINRAASEQHKTSLYWAVVGYLNPSVTEGLIGTVAY
jgi:hypothetical protein